MSYPNSKTANPRSNKVDCKIYQQFYNGISECTNNLAVALQNATIETSKSLALYDETRGYKLPDFLLSDDDLPPLEDNFPTVKQGTVKTVEVQNARLS